MSLMRGRAATHLFCVEFESQANSDDNELMYTTTYLLWTYREHIKAITILVSFQFQSCRARLCYDCLQFYCVLFIYQSDIIRNVHIYILRTKHTFRLLVKTQHRESHTDRIARDQRGNHASEIPNACTRRMHKIKTWRPVARKVRRTVDHTENAH